MATYACSDLHGRLDLLKQIQDFLQPDDTVYFLGDAGDRGPNPWETIKAVAQDKRFIYLKGNHEDMLVKAMEDEVRREGCGVLGKNFALLSQNGGGETFLDWLLEPMKTGWWNYLKKLPTYKKYVNEQGITIHLCHAGFNPMQDDAIPNDDDLLWDRCHWHSKEPIFGDKELCVHGHTPIPYLLKRNNWSDEIPDWDGGAWWYAQDHKVDWDCASWYTGYTVLLDLDSFDEHIFSATDAINLSKKEEW